MKTNFHTHNYRCNHAEGDAFDYVKKAVEEQYDCIGISDHAPMPFYYNDRMEDLDDYLNEIEEAKVRYQSDITVYKGLEIEYFESLHNYYEELLEKVDYLALAVHDFLLNERLVCSFFMKNDEECEQYFKTMIAAIKTGYFKFAAHPDLFGINYYFSNVAKDYTHKLAKVCLEYDFILEFNANGIRRGKDHIYGEERYPYPLKPFWGIMRDYQVKVIVNSDCHSPKLLNDESDEEARRLAGEYGLNVVKTIF